MFHTTSFFTRAGSANAVMACLLAIFLFSGCQQSRMHCGSASSCMPEEAASCGCGSPTCESACEPACQSDDLTRPPLVTKPVRWPANTSKIPGCQSGCTSCQSTDAALAQDECGCSNGHAAKKLFAKKTPCGVMPHSCCARCNGPNCCATCNCTGGSHLPMPGMEVQVCPRCHYRVTCHRTMICQTPDGRVNGCEILQQRQMDYVQPPAVVPESVVTNESPKPAPATQAAPDLMSFPEDSVPEMEPVLPEVHRSAPAGGRRSPMATKKGGSAPLITPPVTPPAESQPITGDSLLLVPSPDLDEVGLVPLPPMQEVKILENDLGLEPELPKMPELPGELDFPAELDSDILPIAPEEDDFIQELPQDARPENPFIDSVSAPVKSKEKTIIREYPEVSEKPRDTPLSSRAPGAANVTRVAAGKPAISVCTFYHPLNEVGNGSKNNQNTNRSQPRRDDMVRPVVFQEPIAQPRSRMDADALAEAAAQSEKAADEARKQRFSDVPPPARKHNVYPHDEYIIDTTQQARIQELKPKRVPAGEIPDDSWHVNAHDAEGTFIHFTTPSGRSSIQTTEPVYIYSPRFRAVRQVVDPTLSGQVVKIGDLNTQTIAETQQRNVGAERATQRNQAISETGRAQAVRLGSISYGAEISEAMVLRGVEQDQTTPQVARQDMTLSHYDMSNSPQVEKKMVGANIWTSTEQMLVFVDHERAAASVMVQNAPSLFVVEEKEEKPRVKIYKVASSDAAKSGETVTFTIRFENAGNTPISNIVIADNLAARLALDTESSESSVDVEFTFEPNANGSSLLRWEVTEPLAPGEWGVVRFNCVVR